MLVPNTMVFTAKSRNWLSRASRQGNKGLNILAPPSQAALDGALDLGPDGKPTGKPNGEIYTMWGL